MRLAGKVIVVTGAGAGIGRACALAYAAEGGRVAVTDRDGATAESVALEIRERGRDAHAWPLDVTNRPAIAEIVEAIVRRLGTLDVWHNNAGVSTVNRFVDLTEAEWDENLDVNAKGVFNCSQVVARYFVSRGQGGKIINTASMAGKRGAVPFLAPYVASKFAVVGLTQAMAFELAEHGITVNAICPGYVATAMQDREVAWEARLRRTSPHQLRQLYVEDTPLRRLETPEDVAHVAVFLASSESDFITGASIDVNGGAWMR